MTNRVIRYIKEKPMNIGIAVVAALGIAAGADITYKADRAAKYLNSDRGAKEIAAFIQRYKAEPEPPAGMSPDQKRGLAAAISEKLGNFEEAGVEFAKLGLADDALRVAGKCPTPECTRKIREELTAYADSLKASAKSE